MPERLRIPGDDVRAKPIAIRTRSREDHSAMRTTLLGGLLDAARHNLAHGADRVALFESGRATCATRRAAGGPSPAASPGERPAPAL